MHCVHPASVNPSAWSSLSMHPVESLLHVSETFWPLVLPSNPIVALFRLHGEGFGAINGRIDFDQLERGGAAALDGHARAHHLHREHLEVDIGADGMVPLDRWSSPWHDGSKSGEAPMRARHDRNKARINARRAAQA